MIPTAYALDENSRVCMRLSFEKDHDGQVSCLISNCDKISLTEGFVEIEFLKLNRIQDFIIDTLRELKGKD